MAILQAIQRIKDNINDLKQNLAKKGINIPADTKLSDMSVYVAKQTPAIIGTYVTIKWYKDSGSYCESDAEAVLNNPLLISYIDATTGKLTQSALTFGNEITIQTYIHSQIFFSAIPTVFTIYSTTVAGVPVTTAITQQDVIETSKLYTILSDNLTFDGSCYIAYEEGNYEEYDGKQVYPSTNPTITIKSKGKKIMSDIVGPPAVIPPIVPPPVITPPKEF